MKKTGHLMPVPDTGQNLTDKVSGTVSDSVSDWVPTPKEAALLEAAGKIGLNRTVSVICEEAGVSRETYYQARKKAGFRAAWAKVACQVIEAGSPGVAGAVTQKAIDGDMTAARLHLQASGMIGSGGMNVHIGDKIDKQLNQYPGQQYGDHRDFVFRAKDMGEFKISMEVADGVAAEMLKREARGEPPLTNQQELLAIKLGTEEVIREREKAAKAAETAAGKGEVIDVEVVEVAEAGDDAVAAPMSDAGV